MVLARLTGCGHARMAVDLITETPRWLSVRATSIAALVCALAGCASRPVLECAPSVEEIASIEHTELLPQPAGGSADSGCATIAPRVRVYVLEPYDRRRTPVLFIHGVNGSPHDFQYLLDRLDQDRYQPWLVHYADDDGLEPVTEQLQEALAELKARYGVRSVAIVAYSMGGLIARDLLLRRQRAALPAVPLLITLSTPWDGHPGAAIGARLALVPAPAWRDMAPGSAYLTSLFGDGRGARRKLPHETQHHLLFSYRKGRVSLGASGDEVVSVASQLLESAQAQAARIYGFDVTHTGILRDAEVAALVEELLDASNAEARMAVVH
jgi:pimeloyl-ACP methyl ester carboxylesterase